MAGRLLGKNRRWIVLIGVFLLLALIATIPSPGTSVGAWLYAFVRGCPGPRPEMLGRKDVLVIGHRGAAGYEVENTIPSMERAVALGANGVEIDLSMTADSVIVLWHDWDPESSQAEGRASGGEPDVIAKPVFPDDDGPYHKPVSELRSDIVLRHFGYEVKEGGRRLFGAIPTLDQFMIWAVAKKELRVVLLDIKIPERMAFLAPTMARLIDSIIASYRPRFRVVYLTPYKSVHTRIDSILPDADLSFDMELPPGLVLDPCEFSSVRHAMEHGEPAASIVYPYTSTITPWTTARRVLECDLKLRASRNNSGTPVDLVFVSTINDEDKYRCLIKLGIDGIVTDYPDRARREMMNYK